MRTIDITRDDQRIEYATREGKRLVRLTRSNGFVVGESEVFDASEIESLIQACKLALDEYRIR